MGDDFQTWWNVRYFETTKPFFKIFRDLHRLGANLDYIDFLRMGLLLRDAIRPNPARLQTREKTYGKFIRSYSAELGSQFMWFGAIAIALTVEEVARRYLPERDANGLLSIQDMRKLLAKTFRTHATNMADKLVKDSQSFQRWRPAKRGNKADVAGSLFLLTVTEHLREATGKPHFAEAFTLLQKLRESYCKPSHQNSKVSLKRKGQSALIRVKNLKKALASWQAYIVELKNFFASLPR